MVDIFSVILIGSLVTFLMYQNINKVTQKIEQSSNDKHPSFSKFATKIIETIREVKKDLDSDMECENPHFCKNDQCDEKEVIKALNDLIRRASFYEGERAKSFSRREAEAEFVDILQKFEEIVRHSCINGQEEALKLKDELHKSYQELIG